MGTSVRPSIGISIAGLARPEEALRIAILADELGYDEVWVAEDYFYFGGISMAAAILASTTRISVGLGIVSAVTRHPAVLAMELATISRLYPGRILPGIGLGLQDWLVQMGLRPDSMLEAMRESVSAIRALLGGARVTQQCRFTFASIELAHPPEEELTLAMGVAGPKMLELSGEIADGTILGLNSSPEYVRWSRDRIAAGQARSGRTGPHRVTCIAALAIDVDRDRARTAARTSISTYLTLSGRNAPTDAAGISDALVEMIERGGQPAVEREMPDTWLDALGVIGDVDDCAAAIERFVAAGADSIALYPQPLDRAEDVLRLAADQLLPRVRESR